MLSKAELFLSANQLSAMDPPEAASKKVQEIYLDIIICFPDNPGFELEKGEKGEEQNSMQLNICAGVIERTRILAFEKMLWRVSKGNVYVKFSDIEEEIKDPSTGEIINKAVFIIFYQVSTILLASFLFCVHKG